MESDEGGAAASVPRAFDDARQACNGLRDAPRLMRETEDADLHLVVASANPVIAPIGARMPEGVAAVYALAHSSNDLVQRRAIRVG